MRAIQASAFQQRAPFPWMNFDGLLRDEAFERLLRSVPQLDSFGKETERKGGSGVRYDLQYRPWLQVAEPWREFIAELEGGEYMGFIRRLFGLDEREELELTMHCTSRRVDSCWVRMSMRSARSVRTSFI